MFRFVSHGSSHFFDMFVLNGIQHETTIVHFDSQIVSKWDPNGYILTPGVAWCGWVWPSVASGLQNV